MKASEFTEGAKVVSPYADAIHLAFGTADAGSVQIATVGPVDAQGLATVTYADGYDLLLNAERCNLIAPAPSKIDVSDNQSIAGIEYIEGKAVVRMYLTELLANFAVARNQARREGLHGTAERLHNDIERFESFGSGFTIQIV